MSSGDPGAGIRKGALRECFRGFAGPGARAPDGTDYRVYHLTVREYLLLGCSGLGVCGLTAYVFYRSWIPFAIVLYIDFTSPGFFEIMYSALPGRLVMTACLVMYAGAAVLSKRILEIEV